MTEQWKPLPDSYTHYNTFIPMTQEDMRGLRDENHFSHAVNTAWTNLAMTIDMPAQSSAYYWLKLGIECSPKNANHDPLRNAYWSDLKAHSILPFIEELRCTESSTVEFEDDKLRKAAFKKSRARYGYNGSLPFVLRTDVDSHLQINPKYPQNKELQGYIDMLKKLNAAHVLTLRPIIEGIQMIQRVHQGTGHIGNDSIEAVQAKLTRIWHESDPYFKLSPQLDNSKQKMEGTLFGEQAEVAGALWQTLVFPRIVTLDEIIDPKMKAANKMYAELERDFYEKRNKVRAPFYRQQKDAFSSLIKMDYSTAASQIAAIAREYPGLFPDFAVDKIKAIIAQQTQAE